MDIKNIKLDINKQFYGEITAKQGDTQSRFLLFSLYNAALQFSLVNRTVRCYMIKPDSTEVFNDLVINDAAKGICTLELTNQILAVPGNIKMELVVYEGTKKLSSIPFTLTVLESINSEAAVISTNEFTTLMNGLASLQEYDSYKNEIKNARDGEVNLLTKVKKIDSQLDTKAKQSDLLIEKARIDSLTALPNGSTTGDAELIDGRIGFDGVNHTNIGNSIRHQGKTLQATTRNIKDKISIENLYNPSTSIDNAIIGNEGVVTTLPDFVASDFIFVGGLEKISISYTHIVRCFDVNKKYVCDLSDMNSIDADKIVALPPNVSYIRFSTFSWANVNAQVGININRYKYKNYGKYHCNNLVKVNEVLVSKTSTNKEAYSVFCEAIIANRDIPNTVITVEAGEYYVYEELKAIKGNSFFENHTTGVLDGYGLEIGNNITIKGSPNAKLIFNYTGSNHSVLANFALLMLKNSDVSIIGLTLIACNCKYVVHDDWYDKTKAFIHQYKDVKMIMDNSKNPLGNNFRCIGGGTGNESHIIIDGCTFEATGTSNVKELVSYHNVVNANTESRITIKNNYFKDTGSLRIAYYGNSTNASDVLITNNSFYRDVNIVSEDGISSIYNFNVIKFNNEIRS